MGSSVPPRSIHRIHATTHRSTRSQRLALTGPWSPLQYSHSRSVSHLHQSSDLPTSLLALDHRWAVGRNHRWRQSWTGIHGGSRRLSLNSRSDGVSRALNFSGSNVGRLFKHSSSTARILTDRRSDGSSGERPPSPLSSSLIPYRSSFLSKRDAHACSECWSNLRNSHDLWTCSVSNLAGQH